MNLNFTGRLNAGLVIAILCDFCPHTSSAQELRDMMLWLPAPDTCALCGMHAKDSQQLVTEEPGHSHENTHFSSFVFPLAH